MPTSPCETSIRLLDGIGEQKRGLFLILDDINGLAGSEAFANWLKSTVDEIATSRRQELVAKQPSLARVFELIDIVPWSDDEVMEFYRNSFGSVNATVGDADLRQLVRFTGGLPVLAHETGDAVRRAARSPEIGSRDVATGISAAAEMIGRKLLEPQVFSAIRSRHAFRKWRIPHWRWPPRPPSTQCCRPVCICSIYSALHTFSRSH